MSASWLRMAAVHERTWEVRPKLRDSSLAARAAVGSHPRFAEHMARWSRASPLVNELEQMGMGSPCSTLAALGQAYSGDQSAKAAVWALGSLAGGCSYLACQMVSSTDWSLDIVALVVAEQKMLEVLREAEDTLRYCGACDDSADHKTDIVVA